MWLVDIVEATNSKDLLSSIKESVPNPTRGFNMKYIEAAKALDMQNIACDSKVIKATHSLYGAMERTPFSIGDYLYAVKRAGSPESAEFLTSENTVEFLKGNLEQIRAAANDGHNIQGKDTAMFIGFMLGLATKADNSKKEDQTSIIRK